MSWTIYPCQCGGEILEEWDWESNETTCSNPECDDTRAAESDK